MKNNDKTKDVLEELLAHLLSKQANENRADIHNGTYLMASDGQMLGKINDNVYDKMSLVNPYGPFGSQYSQTSIFNEYGKYGSQYGEFSPRNPYCQNPPVIMKNGNRILAISDNPLINNAIRFDVFVNLLKNNIDKLLNINNTSTVEFSNNDDYIGMYIEAYDGTFLGSINENRMDPRSLANKFGPFGNKFSPSSILNKFSNYGSKFSSLSPYNKFSNTPPKLMENGSFKAFLTVNTFLKPRIDPDEILSRYRND
jgi:hypothetical protein